MKRTHSEVSNEYYPDLPKWDPARGFEVLIRWFCGCELLGCTHKPADFKRRCPCHPNAGIEAIAVEVNIGDDEESDNPGYSYIPVHLAPRGAFNLKSRRGIRIMLKVRDELSKELRRHRPTEESLDIEEKIEAIDRLIEYSARREPRLRIVQIPKQA